MLQDNALAVHRAKVLFHQEVGEAKAAIGVSTWSVQGFQEGLQADVAYEVIVHFCYIGVTVVLFKGVDLATHPA